MKLHFRTIEKYLKWLLLGWKSSRNIWRKLGCYSDRSTSLPILSCHNLYLREIFWEKKEGRIIFFLKVFFFIVALLFVAVFHSLPNTDGPSLKRGWQPGSQQCGLGRALSHRKQQSRPRLSTAASHRWKPSVNPVYTKAWFKFNDCCS